MNKTVEVPANDLEYCHKFASEVLALCETDIDGLLPQYIEDMAKNVESIYYTNMFDPER